MKKGQVYWITGLHGSGKTTLGTALYYDLREQQDNVLILDGDVLKNFVGDVVGYTTEARRARAMRYAHICKILADQGMCVIICTISMFDEVRSWNRKHISGYIEVFLEVSPDVLKKRDEKELYLQYGEMQFPEDSDLVLHNDFNMPITFFVDQIKKIVPRNEEDFARDRNYWNRYYSERNDMISSPSLFAMSIAEELAPQKSILDLGCGNGRDSFFFLDRGLYVTGIDASDSIINELREKTKNNDKALFVCDNFVKCTALFQRKYDYIYSRFTLHAITEKQEEELLVNIFDALKPSGKLFIEARTIHDDLYGKGEMVAENSFYYDGHFRRFLDPSVIEKKLIGIGFEIMSVHESKGFSKTEKSDPTLVRIIAKSPI